ncbi:hypothetical protein Tco_0772715 [Tanacetum coccineum]|uniref:Uncharacterized protein n=1 Tax=Tanacetum coccineum TaxID=301880 RepID=A0ABQ4ZIN4_9ASTR
MDDPNMTMEEYIKLEEGKARRRGRVFNWETTTYGKIKVDDDLDDLRYVETKFPAIVIDNAFAPQDALLCKSQVSTPVNDEIDFRISFDESDDEDYTIIYMAPLPACDQRHLWLRYQVEGYTEEIVHDFEQRLETIFGRQVNRVHILDFKGLTPDMRQDLAERMGMVYTKDDGQEVFVSHAWRRLFGIRAPLVQEFILEFFSTCRIRDEMGLDVAGTLCFQMGGARRSMTWRQFILALGLHTAEEMAEDGFGAYWLGSERLIPDKGDLSDYWVEISSSRDFLRGAPSYTYIRDPVRRLCHRLISYNISGRGQAPKKVTATDLFYLRSMDRGAANVPYLLAQYLFRHAKGRKSGARLSGGHFIGSLAYHFALVSDDGLRGLSVVARELPLIDMRELVKLNICMDLRDDWAWVALGPERQQAATAGAPEAAEDAPVIVEGD